MATGHTSYELWIESKTNTTIKGVYANMDDEKRDEENSNETNGSSWWGWGSSWLQNAKEKSSTALEFMKRDLTEFSQVVQTGSVAAVSSTAAKIKEKLTVDNAEAVANQARQSFTSVIETITDVFAPPLRELEDSELMIIKDSEPVVMDWWQTQLYLIQKDPKTFCHEPEGPPEIYENWLESFHLADYQEEMTEIMMTSSEIRTIYDKLVPTSVSHIEFWQRYFYRVHLLKKAEAKRADLMRRAEQISIDDIEWDTELNTADGQFSNLNEQKHNTNDSKNSKAEGGSSNQKESAPNFEPRLDNETIEKESDVSNRNESTQNEVLGNSPEKLAEEKTDNVLSENISNETFGNPPDPTSADSSDGSRLSPIESLGKESSTGDEWEKDFDLELNENDIKNLINSEFDTRKEEEDDWEKWQ